MKSALRLFPIHVAAATLLFISAGRAQEVTIDQVADQPFITLSSEEASDFSGLTWRGEDNYVAVSDKHRALFPLRLRVDRATGRILEGSFGAKIPIQTALGDFEGIALGARRLFVSAESGNGIFSVNPDGGDYRALKVPKIFTKTRPNKGLESLTYGAGTFWTANEEALVVDGNISNEASGTVVRIQKFDASFRPLAQYAYRTERCGWRIHGAGTGLSDLLALPNGKLLALERVITRLGLVVKIYEIDFSGAADISRLPSLADGSTFVPLKKTLLYDHPTLTANFEGITLGPELEEGWRSLILVADSGSAPTHMFMALRIRFAGK